MKPDYILIALGLAIVAIVVTQTMTVRPDPVDVVARDCALFYGPIGKEAEQHCRTQMLDQHLLSSNAPATKG
jgi:hypothetical protein